MDAGAETGHFRRKAAVWGQGALNLLFPPLCMACRAPVAAAGQLCAQCWGKIAFLEGAMCACCGLPFDANLSDADSGGEMLCAACHAETPAFDRARSVMRYDDASRGLVLAFKWADRLDLTPGLARWLDRAGRALTTECDLIVPVPLHRIRLWRRRYNQAAVAAAALSRLCGTPFDPFVLRRIRSTASQGTMVSAAARRRNVAAVFGIAERRRPSLQGRTVLLVDDVHTTGATLEACARVLKRGGAARVFALTLARVVRPHEAGL
jgi:ComF family protein